MDLIKSEIAEKKLLNFESKKMILEFEELIEKKKFKSKNIEKHQFRTFLKNYEVNQIQHLNFEQRSIIVKKFYKHFGMPFFDADFKNLESNTQFILQKTVPLILGMDEIPKSEITRVISDKLDLTINENFSFKDKGERTLIKQVAFRAIFENFLPELRACPDNALFVK